MEIARPVNRVWTFLGKADKFFLGALALYLVSGWAGWGGLPHLLLFLLLILAGAWVGIKWLRAGMRKAIWRLRNRLIVAYLFMALVPVLLIGVFFALGSWVLAGQAAVYIVSSEFNRRLDVLQNAAETMARAPAAQREQAWARVQEAASDYYPKLTILIRDHGVARFPAQPAFRAPAQGWGPARGVVARDRQLYLWARVIDRETEVTVLAPLTTQFLDNLAPGLGEVDLIHAVGFTPGQGVRWDMRAEGGPRQHVPPARNRFDFDFSQATSIPLATWNTAPKGAAAPGEDTALLSVHSRLSVLLDTMFRQQTLADVWLMLLYIVGAVFLLVEVVSLVIGVSLTRTITGAVHDLYEGTERIQAGDFSHRIEARGNDQIATVSQSFNRMTEHLERLLVVAKEKERLQTELEIAREVQAQLYPKRVPALRRLQLQAQCKPARLVSGDYYDYQMLREGAAVLAIGDVAGKGISAALLMASLQSSLRTQVRACLQNGGGAPLSTSFLVSQLNQLLYADTAPEKFATFLFAIYDDETGVLTYTNAGHLPPVLVRQGRATQLDVNGMVVGAFPFAKYDESQVELQPGDLLFCYTDGITEPENEYGEMFGEQRLIDLVVRNADRDTDHLITTVMSDIEAWTGSPELQDDMTLLVARRI